MSPTRNSINFNDVLKRGDIFYQDDVVKHKARHGSHLYEAVRLLPEFRVHYQRERPPVSSCSSLEMCPKLLDHQDMISFVRVPTMNMKYRKIIIILVVWLGATVELCENGRQALDLVRNALVN
ncbi:unnamed protein product [Prunus armeniaca]|uniref:Uncharacterized protein n=1 Tax=Prunus armeniaca TaxID=36596 RepID=A0A6J5YCS0_PRUAR|nr:unnamed protein product [Prunus armeniaca]